MGDAVVVKRDFATSPHFGMLLDGLGHRARQLSDGLPEVEVLVDSRQGVGVQPGLKASATPLLQ